MPVPIVYRKAADTAIATYDFFSFASSIGYKRFYLSWDASSQGILVEQQLGSDKVCHQVTGTGTDSYNFDLEFQKPLTLFGGLVSSIPIGNTTDGSGTNRSRVDIYVKKVDLSAVEEVLAQASGALMQVGSSTAARKYNFIQVQVPKTLFKKGEKLRLTLDHVRTEKDAGNPTFALGHDPLGRDKGAGGMGDSFDWLSGTFQVNSRAIVDVPFQVDL